MPSLRTKRDHQQKPIENYPSVEKPRHETPSSQLGETGQPQDLWDQAHKRLREDKTYQKLMETYEKILVSELNDGKTISSDVDMVNREIQMSGLVKKKVKLMEESRWSFRLGHQTVEAKAQVDRIVKGILWAKDFVTSAVSAEPHAALAWAGVCVILPLLLNPTTQAKALVDGLDDITDIIARFTVTESLYLQQRREPVNRSQDVIKLYD